MLNKNNIIAFALMLSVISTAAVSFATNVNAQEREDKPEISQEIKTQLQEIRSLLDAGEFEEAKLLKDSLKEQGVLPEGKRGFGKDVGHKKMKELIESGDFEAWSNEMLNREKFPSDQITKENFNEMVKIHELMEAGDFDEAKERREALHEKMGMTKKDFESRGERRGRNPEVKEAIENNDFETWKNLMTEHDKFPTQKITEETFNTLVEISELREAGDREAVKAKLDELGLKGPRRNKLGFRSR